jgi:hypothetical protein
VSLQISSATSGMLLPRIPGCTDAAAPLVAGLALFHGTPAASTAHGGAPSAAQCCKDPPAEIWRVADSTQSLHALAECTPSQDQLLVLQASPADIHTS